MDDSITLQSLSGAALLPHLDAVAALRIAVEIDPRKGDAIPSTKGVL